MIGQEMDDRRLHMKLKETGRKSLSEEMTVRGEVRGMMIMKQKKSSFAETKIRMIGGYLLQEISTGKK